MTACADPRLARLATGFTEVAEVFDGAMRDADARLTPTGVDAFLDAARRLGGLGRGVEPMLALLEGWPHTASEVGEGSLEDVMATVMRIQRSPNGTAIAPLLQSLPAVARRLPSREQFDDYLDLCLDLMSRTTVSIHGRQDTIASPSLVSFVERAPHLLTEVTIAGLRSWVDYGIRNHGNNPDRQREYFRGESPDSVAVLARERNGTLFVDHERELELYLRGLWDDGDVLIPYSTMYHTLRKPIPYYDRLGIRLPDAYEDETVGAGPDAVTVSGIDRYRAALAHIAGHRRWSTSLIADNWSPFQRMAVEFFEDARIDALLCRRYPGLRRLLLRLHPYPVEGACDPLVMSCLRHRLAMLSRACLDPHHGYADPDLLEFVGRFHALLDASEAGTARMADLALEYVSRTRRQSDQLADVWFEDTVIDYRDDNRHLWTFIEDGDEEESFTAPTAPDETPPDSLPPRHYPEWDHRTGTYRPDWVTVYEGLHPSGSPGDIDALLAKHAALAKRMQRLLDLLKPQDRVRIRYQEDGGELDLDIAIRSLIDLRSGVTPDQRINFGHRTDGRDIAVLLLLDLSQSLDDPVPGTDQTVLELSREAVALLAQAIETLGDAFAIAGFRSNTRHDVRYLHIKGFSEGFDEPVKARLADMDAGWSTRLGAAIRHAGHYLSGRRADKRLLLVLTDGVPSDVDVDDERMLVEDANRAVQEVDRDGIFSYCISLDPRADEYVSDVFGRQYTVIDHIERLPERLPELFLALTR